MMNTKLFKNTFILLAIIGLLNFIASKLYLYEFIWWIDILMHFLAGACVGMAVLLVIFYRKKFEMISNTRLIWLGILGALTIGVLWELYELYFGITMLSDGMPYITDTISDLLMDILGGFFGAIYGINLSKNK